MYSIIEFMKRIRKYYFNIYLFCFLFLIKPAFAQQNDNNSAFGAPVIKFTSLAGQSSVMFGGRFGWMINKSIVLGGGIYGLVSKVKTGMTDPISGQDVLLGFNCGGLEFEYVFLSEKPVHFSIDMLFAGGGITYSVTNKSVDHTSYFSQNLLLWEPQFNIEYEVVDWLHLAAGVSYRIITSYKGYYSISQDDLKGFSGLITFKFGRY